MLVFFGRTSYAVLQVPQYLMKVSIVSKFAILVMTNY